ncbi:hypothetical protein [Paraburkholderia sp. J41]|uniref:hypothetical protein n=1 Tax=Paraburkholderia sp. J41 TaxID=2805433 RepID=UPI002AC35630|nr:hypothetical protein [Paraburkholderia sp. J41]
MVAIVAIVVIVAIVMIVVMCCRTTQFAIEFRRVPGETGNLGRPVRPQASENDERCECAYWAVG